MTGEDPQGPQASGAGGGAGWAGTRCVCGGDQQGIEVEG